MSLGTARSSFSSTYVEPEKGFLSFLDRFSNVPKSAIVGDFENSFRSMFPFVDYKYIPASRVTKQLFGVEHGALSVLTDIALDFTTYLGGAGILTKAGKLEKARKELNLLRKGLKTAARTTGDVKLMKESRDIGRAIRALEKVPEGPARSIVKLNLPFQGERGIHIGDANKLAALIAQHTPASVAKRVKRIKRAIDKKFKSVPTTEEAIAATAIRERQRVRGERIVGEEAEKDIRALDQLDHRIGVVTGSRDADRAAGIEAADVIRGRVPGRSKIEFNPGGLFRGTPSRKSLPSGPKAQIKGVRFVSTEEEYAKHYGENITEFGFRLDTKILKENDELHKRIAQEDYDDNWELFQKPEVIKELREAGYDAIELRELAPMPGMNPGSYSNRPVKTYMVLNPKKLQPKHTVNDEIEKFVSKSITKINRDLQKQAIAGEISNFQRFSKFQEALPNILREAELKRVNYQRAYNAWGKLTPEEHELILGFADEFEAMFQLEHSLGRTDRSGNLIKRLESNQGLFGYLPRILSKPALAMKRNNRKVYAQASSKFNSAFRSAAKRKLFPEETVAEVNKILRKPVKDGGMGLNFDFYTTDPVEIMARRRTEHHEFLAKRQMADIISDAAHPERLKKSDVTIKAMYKRLDIHEGQSPEGYIPREIITDLTKQQAMLKQMMDPSHKGIHKFLQQIDHFHSYFRVNLTSFFPAKMHRDLLGNIYNMNLADAFSFRSMSQARGLYKKVADAGSNFDIEDVLKGEDLKLWREMQDHGIIVNFERGETSDFLKTIGTRQKLDVIANRPTDSLQNLLAKWAPIKKAPEKNQFAFNKLWGRAYNKYIDNVSRMSMYLTLKKKGMNGFQAKATVDKFLFDYTKLTPFEQQYLRPNFLFYTWSRKNIPLVINTLITQPRIAATYNHLMGGSRDDNVPDWMRSGQAFKAPDIFGKNKIIQRIGLPIEDLNLFNTDRADPSGDLWESFTNKAQRFGFNLASNLGPASRVPLEVLTGSDFFRGRDLDTLDFLNYVETNSPTSRITRTMKKFFEDPVSAASVIDLMTGFRFYEYNEAEATRDTLRRSLLKTGKFQRINFPGVTRRKEFKDERPLPQETQLRQIEKLLKERKR